MKQKKTVKTSVKKSVKKSVKSEAETAVRAALARDPMGHEPVELLTISAAPHLGMGPLRAILIVQGPEGSGKTLIIRDFLRGLSSLPNGRPLKLRHIPVGSGGKLHVAMSAVLSLRNLEEKAMLGC